MSEELENTIRTLADTASQQFRDQQYTKALETLNKLKKIKDNTDPRISHNIAVAEYYLSLSKGNDGTRRLLEELNKTKGAMERVSHTHNKTEENEGGERGEEGEEGEESVSNSSNSSSGSHSHTSTEIDSSMLQYNKAVIYKRTKHYYNSLGILEELYKNIVPMEDYLAVRVCFLLLDIYLVLRQADKGFGVISYLEKMLASTIKSAEKSTQQQQQQQQQQQDDDDDGNNSRKLLVGEAGNENSITTTTTTTTTLSTTSPTTTLTSSTTTTKSLKLSLSEFQFMVHLYKAKLQLQKKVNLKAVKQDIKLALSVGSKLHPLSVPACTFLKAHLEYARHNHKKAIKLMNSCGQKGSNGQTPASSVPPESGYIGVNCSIEGGLAPLYFNNLGCISYKLKKFNASCFYLSKSLKEIPASNSSEDSVSSSAESSTNAQGRRAQQNKSSTPPTAVPTCDHQGEILYNMGIQLLLTGKPELAFQSFQEAALVYYRTPSIWLRLAECCIAVHVLRLREDAKTRQKSSLIWRVSGGSAGANSKSGNADVSSSPPRILLPIGGGSQKGLQIEDTDVSSSTDETDETSSGGIRMGTLSLEYASKCLRNCLFLLPKVPSPILYYDSDEDDTNNNGNNNNINYNNTEESEVADPNSPSIHQNELRQAALVNLAFVSLAINNSVVALSSALDLLSFQNNCINIYKYLAHIYAAEALCVLNKPAQAMQHLSPSILDGIFPVSSNPPSTTAPPASAAATPAFSLTGTHPSPYSSLTSSQPVPNVARSMLYTNLAAAHILREDLAQAQSCVTQALTYQPSSSRGLLLQVYLELRKGNTEAALDILKRGRPAPKRKTRR